MNSIDLKNNSTKLSQLFHYSPSEKKNGALQSALREYQFLLTVSLQTSEMLEERNLECLDSLVGENACEIRAIKTALLASKHLPNSKALSDQAHRIKNEIEQLLDSPKQRQIRTLMRKNDSLQDVLTQKNWDIDLTPEQQFLIESFVLSKSKHSSASQSKRLSLMKKEQVAQKNLGKLFPHITTSFAKHTIAKFRQNLATASVEYVREVAKELNNDHLQRMVSPDFTYLHNDWLPCTPMFWTYKILLEKARREELPILIHVKFLQPLAGTDEYLVNDEEYILYKTEGDTKERPYIQASIQPFDTEVAACVVEGAVCSRPGALPLTKAEWKQEMSRHSIIDLILAGAADHRQYPNDDKKVDVEDQEWEYYKLLAKALGCSNANPTLFFIQHVFASQVGHLVPQGAIPSPSPDLRASYTHVRKSSSLSSIR
ncbi:MAG: hypothetical protein KGJ02_04370 [Verrucomicrobiota bacterium]|nr:hypothetical protein [Verrucomicrobiota bacterium]